MVTGYNPLSGNKTGTRVSTAAKRNPIAKGNSSGGWGDAQRLANVVVPGIVARGDTVTGTTLKNYDRDWLSTMSAGRNAGLGTLPTSGLGTGGGGGGGRGGGGGGGAAGMTQEQLDWITNMLRGGQPQAMTANTLDLPDYAATFDPTVYNELEGKLGEAGTQSRAAAGEAYTNLENYLNTNNRNAFAGGPPQAAAPGMDAGAMQRMLQSQGVGPEAVAANQQGAAAGNAAFGNLWSLLGANENTAQQNRLARVQTDRGTTNRGIDAAMLQGRTGIGMQRGQAQTAFNERAEQMRNQIAQQEAMANWTRANQVTDTNAQNQAAYRNQQIQTMLGLLPNLGKLTLPDLQAMGIG